MNRTRGTGISEFLVCSIVLCMIAGGFASLGVWINLMTHNVGVMRYGVEALAEFIEAEGRWPRDWDDLNRGLGGDDKTDRVRFLRQHAKIRFDLDLESIDPQDLVRLRVVIGIPHHRSDEFYRSRLERLKKAIEAHQRCVRGEPPPADEP